MADLMQGLLQGMQNPMFGMGVGVLSGNGLGQGLQQGLLNAQAMSQIQQRNQQATQMMSMRVEEMRQKRMNEQRAMDESAARQAMYPGVLPGMTVPGDMIKAQARGLQPGTPEYNKALEGSPLVQNVIGGQQTAAQPWTDDEKASGGFQKDAVVYTDQKTGLPKVIETGVKEGDQYQKLGASQDAYKSYRTKLKEYGPQIVPSGDKLELKAAYNNLMLEAKELFNLGVLQGPDMDIMNAVMQDPTIWQSQLYSGDDLVRQLDSAFGGKLEAARARLDERYGKTQKTPADEIINFEDLK